MRSLLIGTIVAIVTVSCQAAEQTQPISEKQKNVAQLLEAFANAPYFWQQVDVAEKIIALGDKSIIPRIEKYLQTEDRRRRCNAGRILAGLGDTRGVAIILKELEDKSPRPTDLILSNGKPYPEGQVRADRCYAAHVLGLVKDKKAVPALIEATRDETISYQAAISLGEIGEKSAIPALRKMARDFPTERLWAGYGLATLGESEGFDILAEIALSDSSWVQRRHAVEAMGIIGNPRSVPTVVKALKDAHVNVRVSAARTLGKIGDPKALPALSEALSDKEITKINAPTTVEKEARAAIEAIEAKKK